MTYRNSKTFRDLLDEIPELSKPYSVFKEFLGTGKWILIQGLSRTFKEVWQYCSMHSRITTTIC